MNTLRITSHFSSRGFLGLFLGVMLFQFSGFVYAQKEGNIWYFGFAGLDFNQNPPVPLTNGNPIGSESSSCYSDSSGNLMFYTDGLTVWDKNHQVMTNGSGLMGGWSSSQVLIVKKPCSKHIYYIFTTPHQTLSSEGLRYSVVDMSRQSGMGEVVQKNILLFQPQLEKVAAVRHANATDIWLVTHQWNSSNFLAFLIDGDGISATPVVSAVGLVHTGPTSTDGNAIGNLVPSADGSMLSIGMSEDGVYELFKFNNSTGIVSDPVTLPYSPRAYDSEFSPQGNMFYFTRFDSTISHCLLYQADLSVPWTSTSISATITLIDTVPLYQNPSGGGGTSPGIEAGPDGKIYISVLGGTFISAITQPELQGTACQFTDTASTLAGQKCGLGLPQFINDQFRQYGIDYTNNCTGDTVYFSLTDTSSIISVQWDFGDSTSAANTSALFSPAHLYTSGGTYTVTAIVNQNGNIDTLIRVIPVYSSFDISGLLGSDTIICPGDTVRWDAGNYSCADILWSDGTMGSTMAASTEGVYWVLVSGMCGESYDSVIVTTTPLPVAEISGSDTICPGTVISLSASGGTKFQWSTGSTDQQIIISEPGTYSVNVTNYCGSDTSLFTVHPDTLNVYFTASPISGVTPLHVDLFNQSAGADTYLWDFGQGEQGTSFDTSVIYHQPGTYLITLWASSPYGCTGTYSITIEVLDVPSWIYLPNVFSPNGDGRNDLFRIGGESIRRVRAQIFNRWGQLLHAWENPEEGWDGTNARGDMAPEGVYYLTAEIETTDGIIHKKTSTVTLTR